MQGLVCPGCNRDLTPDYCTLKEASDEVKLSTNALGAAVRKGRLDGAIVGHTVLVRRDALTGYNPRRRGMTPARLEKLNAQLERARDRLERLQAKLPQTAIAELNMPAMEDQAQHHNISRTRAKHESRNAQPEDERAQAEAAGVV